jgi:hypothetical protein
VGAPSVTAAGGGHISLGARSDLTVGTTAVSYFRRIRVRKRVAWADPVATDALRSLWAEPRPTNAPDRGPRDWALVAALVGWSVLEVVLREDLAPLPVLLVAVLAVVGPLLWRRSHPLVAVAVSFGILTIVDSVRILTGSQGGCSTAWPPR